MNLIDLLPAEDKKLMTRYIHLYGIGEKDFIGLDQYLKPWAESKKKLYKLLGNQFQLEIPYTYEKTKDEMINRFDGLMCHSFVKTFENFLVRAEVDRVNTTDLSPMWDLLSTINFCNDKTPRAIKFEIKETGKEIRLQAGMKPMRALQRIVSLFPSCFSKEEFEDFRIKHSLCLNDKQVKGTLVLSIHPFDFITMSDNSNDWSSCMSWRENGCYHLGTVEMMNSNNVICAYIKSSSKPFVFDKEKGLEWNNKKWRQLIYVTKDIIVSGKPYPYHNKNLSLVIIEELKKLAGKNLSWNYTFGPEKYSDMIHINGKYSMDRNRAWLKNNESTKHNILFDTKGMYNDMLNCNSTDYWCYRNKVPKLRIISVSGKAPCACCGEPALYESSYSEDYNDRYSDPEKIICYQCQEDGECDICYSFKGKESLVRVKSKYDEIRFCSSCAKEFLIKCPCCGEYISTQSNPKQFPGIRLREKVHLDEYDLFDSYRSYRGYLKHEKNQGRKSIVSLFSGMGVIPAFICENCIDEDLKDENGFFTIKELERTNLIWYGSKKKEKIISKKVYTEEEIINNPFLSKLLYANIEHYQEDNNLD